jgi:hypothetical protein
MVINFINHTMKYFKININNNNPLPFNKNKFSPKIITFFDNKKKTALYRHIYFLFSSFSSHLFFIWKSIIRTIP